jgi:hypothetical protein
MITYDNNNNNKLNNNDNNNKNTCKYGMQQHNNCDAQHRVSQGLLGVFDDAVVQQCF